jgi:formylglycine-generating enzyme required for sulfatase activity
MKIRAALMVCVMYGLTSSPVPAQTIFEDNFDWGTVCAWSSAVPATDCSMAWVAAGEFTMGTNTGSGDEDPQHAVYLNAFSIDWMEVTVADFAACVSSGSCVPPDSDSGCNWGVAGHDAHPVNCLDWYQASSYCGWAGKRLPTEAEWERAAGGTDGRTYPWGEATPSCTYAVMHDDSGWGCGADGTWPVGSIPAGVSPVGALDIAGNVQEWVSDWYDVDYYASSPYANPTGPLTGTRKVMRGGSWANPADSPIPFFQTTDRDSEEPAISKYSSNGFRCAKDSP